MVRRGMKPWLGLAGLMVLVGVLAFVALDRVDGSPTLGGRWELVVVETPEGDFEPEQLEWIDFDGTYFTGQMSCIDFEGDFTVSRGGGFLLNGWGWSGGCVESEGTSYAFENYFSEITEIRFDPDLIMRNGDGSVRFVFTRGEPAEADALRAW